MKWVGGGEGPVVVSSLRNERDEICSGVRDVRHGRYSRGFNSCDSCMKECGLCSKVVR